MTEEQLDAIEELRTLKGKKRKARLFELAEEPDGFGLLEGLLEDEEVALRKAAVESVEGFGEEPPEEVYGFLEKALENAETSVRNAALKRIEALPPRGSLSVALVQWLSVKKAREILMAYGSTAVPALSHVLEHGDNKSRKKAIEVLAELGEEASAAAELIVAALDDEDKAVRKAAHEALPKIGADREAIEEQVIAALQKGDKQAAETVKSWGVDAIDIFESLLDSDDSKIRTMGLTYMAECTEHLEDDDEYERLIEAMTDSSAAVRRAALRLFDALPFPVEGALAHIDALFAEPEAASVLVKYGADAIPTFRDIFQSTTTSDRRTFIQIIDQLKPEVIEPMVDGMLQMIRSEWDSNNLIEGIGAMARLEALQEKLPEHIEHHQDHWDPRVSKAAREALEALGHESRPSMWEGCRLHSSVIRHLHRLGATYESTEELQKSGDLSELQQRMKPALFDLIHGVKWPHHRTFNTFEAYGETTFSDWKETFVPEEVEAAPDCYVFAHTDHRVFGIDLDQDSADPSVYVAWHEGYEGYRAWYGLSRFLAKFERPKS